MPRLALKLMALLVLLLAAYGTLVAAAFTQAAREREAASLQALSRSLAAQLVERFPLLAGHDDGGEPAAAARRELMTMLMAVNPGVRVYRLDAGGRVVDYLGEPGMVRQRHVDLAPLAAFAAGAALPLVGTDPMAPAGEARPRLFSAAPFADGSGHLYVVLDGAERVRAAQAVGDDALWRSAAGAALAGLAVAGLVGALVVWRGSRPLVRLAARMQGYAGLAGADSAAAPPDGAGARPRDEVQTLAVAFERMTARIESQAAAEREQAAAHREAMAGIAHDLRTPLTALHGHLEALALREAEPSRRALVDVALAQSGRLGRLLQQLFELAALEASSALPVRERFRLDELVADTVGKLRPPPVAGGAPALLLQAHEPGALEVEGDLELVERALANLIDNALRHAGGAGPVEVRLAVDGAQAQVVVADAGPGLPDAVRERLAATPAAPLALRTRGPGGGLGGLGLAIARRIAVLHGGELRVLPPPAASARGTRLCLALPRAG